MKTYFKTKTFYSDLFATDIPDFKDGKYLMETAAAAKDMLFAAYGGHLDYKLIKGAYDLLKEARKHYSPAQHTNWNDIEEEDKKSVEKGYREYCSVIDNIMTKLAAALWIAINLQEEPEEDMWAFHYRNEAENQISEAIYGKNGLNELANGKIWFKPGVGTGQDMKERKFDYVYTTSTIWEENGKKYYLPDFGDLEGLRKELKK